jgi:hypothetical protein
MRLCTVAVRRYFPTTLHDVWEQNQQSMMTFEGQQHGGGEAIIAKLKSFGETRHEVKTVDVQPSTSPNAMCIFVTGAVKIGADANPLHFCEFFQLVSTGGNNYYVHNDIFRLNYGL